MTLENNTSESQVDSNERTAKIETIDLTDPASRLDEHTTLLEIYCANLASQLSESMGRYLRCPVKLFAVHPTICSFNPNSRDENKVDFARLYRLQNMGGLIGSVMPNNLVYRLVDILFGGLGDLESQNQDRVLSPTEENMIDVLSEKMAQALINIVQSSTSLDSELTTEAWSSQQAAQDGRVEAMVVIPLKIEWDDQSDSIELWFSLSILELLLGEKLLPSQDGTAEDPSWTSSFKNQVFDCNLDLKCVLTEMSMPLSRVSNFAVGDFIPLADVSEATLSIQSLPLFKAKVGVVNEQASASFSRWL